MGYIKKLKLQLTNEGQQGLIRVVFLSFISIYLLFNNANSIGTISTISYLVYSCFFLFLLIKKPQFNAPRQWIAMFVDIGMASYGMLMIGTQGGIFIGLYLWLVIGYGLRYGINYTKGAYVLALIGYLAATHYNPYWSAHKDVVYGFLLTLVLIPIHTILLQRKLELATIKANSASEAKSKFLSHMSHEIRTPLNGIVGAVELLTESNLNNEQKQHLYHLRNASITLRQLVNDILDISKIEQGKMELNLAPLNLIALVEEIKSSFNSQAKRKDLTFECEIDKNLHPHFKGDSLHLKQVLNNLISNSIKFTKEGSVKVSVTQLNQDSNNQNSSIKFSVSDTGVGIAADKQSKIFNSFSQADASIATEFGGTGLGTSIAKNLVELMGGTISFVSTYGAGTTFEFVISMEKLSYVDSETSQKTNHHNVITLKEHALAKNKFKKCILIADDNQTNRYILSATLRAAGYKVVEAINGDEALDILENTKCDLMMLDLNMPLINGIDVTKIHRSLALHNAIPSVIVTADATLDTKNKCVEAEINAVLTKPFNQHEVLEIVNNLLDTAEKKANKYTVAAPLQLGQENKSLEELALLDMRKINSLSKLTNNPDFMANLIAGFISDTDLSMNRLQNAVQTGDFLTLNESAHTIAGNSGNMGAERFHAACQNLYALSQSDEIEQWEDAFKDAKKAFALTKLALMDVSHAREVAVS